MGTEEWLYAMEGTNTDAIETGTEPNPAVGTAGMDCVQRQKWSLDTIDGLVVSWFTAVVVTDIVVFAVVKVVLGVVIVNLVFVVAKIFGFGRCVAHVVFGLNKGQKIDHRRIQSVGEQERIRGEEETVIGSVDTRLCTAAWSTKQALTPVRSSRSMESQLILRRAFFLAEIHAYKRRWREKKED